MDRNSDKSVNRFVYLKEHEELLPNNLICYAGIAWPYIFGNSWFSSMNDGERIVPDPSDLSAISDQYIKSAFVRVDSDDNAPNYQYFLHFMTDLLGVSDTSWTSNRIRRLLDIPCITITPEKLAFNVTLISNNDYIMQQLSDNNLTVNDVKNSFFDLVITIVGALNIFKIGNATSLSIPTDKAITLLYRLVESYYAQTRTDKNTPKLYRPNSTEQFILHKRNSSNPIIFNTEYSISMKEYLSFITPFIKEYFGAKDGKSCIFLQDESIQTTFDGTVSLFGFNLASWNTHTCIDLSTFNHDSAANPIKFEGSTIIPTKSFDELKRMMMINGAYLFMSIPYTEWSYSQNNQDFIAAHEFMSAHGITIAKVFPHTGLLLYACGNDGILALFDMLEKFSRYCQVVFAPYFEEAIHPVTLCSSHINKLPNFAIDSITQNTQIPIYIDKVKPNYVDLSPDMLSEGYAYTLYYDYLFTSTVPQTSNFNGRIVTADKRIYYNLDLSVNDDRTKLLLSCKDGTYVNYYVMFGSVGIECININTSTVDYGGDYFATDAVTIEGLDPDKVFTIFTSADIDQVINYVESDLLRVFIINGNGYNDVRHGCWSEVHHGADSCVGVPYDVNFEWSAEDKTFETSHILLDESNRPDEGYSTLFATYLYVDFDISESSGLCFRSNYSDTNTTGLFDIKPHGVSNNYMAGDATPIVNISFLQTNSKMVIRPANNDIQINAGTRITIKAIYDFDLLVKPNSGYNHFTYSVYDHNHQLITTGSLSTNKVRVNDGNYIQLDCTATSYLYYLAVIRVPGQYDESNLVSNTLGTLCSRILSTDGTTRLADVIASYLTPDPEIISPTLLADSLSFFSESNKEAVENFLLNMESFLNSEDDDIPYYDIDDNIIIADYSNYYTCNKNGEIVKVDQLGNISNKHPLASFVCEDQLAFDLLTDYVTMPYYDDVSGTVKYNNISDFRDSSYIFNSTNNAEINQNDPNYSTIMYLYQLLLRIRILSANTDSAVDDSINNFSYDYATFLANDLCDLSDYVNKLVDVYGDYLSNSLVSAFGTVVDNVGEVASDNVSLVSEYVDSAKEEVLSDLSSKLNDLEGATSDSGIIIKRLLSKAQSVATAAASKVKTTAQQCYLTLGTIKSNVSTKVKALSDSLIESTSNLSSGLMNLLGLSNTQTTTSTGWDDKSSITNTSNLSLALDCSIKLDSIGKVAKSVASLINKGVNWVYNKASKYVAETVKDGVSFVINDSGFETLSIAQYQMNYSREQLIELYPNIGEYFTLYTEMRKISDNIYMCFQINSILFFVQKLSDDLYMVSGNSLLDLGTPILSKDSSDLDFIDQIIFANNKSITDYNNFVTAWNNINSILHNYYSNIPLAGLQKYALKDRNELYSKIFSGAYVAATSAKAKKAKAWGWLSVAVGSVLCFTGVGSSVGAGLIVAGAATVATAAAVNYANRDYSIDKVVAKAREDSSYANQEISTAELLGAWCDIPSGIFSVYMNMADSVLWPASLIHCGAGKTTTCYDANHIEYEGYIPMAINSGFPNFKYRILSDKERQSNTRLRCAIIVAVVAAFVAGSAILTKGMRLKHKFKKYSARQWSLDKKGYSLKKYEKIQGKYAWKLNKISGSLGGDSSNKLFSMVTNYGDSSPTTTELLENATTNFNSLSTDLDHIDTNLTAVGSSVAALDLSSIDNSLSLLIEKVNGLIRNADITDDKISSIVGYISNDILPKLDQVHNTLINSSDESTIGYAVAGLVATVAAVSASCILIDKKADKLLSVNVLTTAYKDLGYSEADAKLMAQSFLLRLGELQE